MRIERGLFFGMLITISRTKTLENKNLLLQRCFLFSVKETLLHYLKTVNMLDSCWGPYQVIFSISFSSLLSSEFYQLFLKRQKAELKVISLQGPPATIIAGHRLIRLSKKKLIQYNAERTCTFELFSISPVLLTFVPAISSPLSLFKYRFI